MSSLNIYDLLKLTDVIYHICVKYVCNKADGKKFLEMQLCD